MSTCKIKKNKKHQKERLRIFFDCETFNKFSEESEILKSKKKTKPFIVPYLIGACSEEDDSYEVFIGPDSSDKFLSWLYEKCSGENVQLYAFNIDFDFQALKPFIIAKYPTTRISYRLTSKKKFIFGRLYDPTHKINIEIKDLWIWDKARSLSSYYDEITKLSKTDSEWTTLLEKHKLTELRKTKIDYYKKNLRQEGDNLIYEDFDDITKTLDLPLELAYVKNDVIGLPLIREYIERFKLLCVETLDLKKVVHLGDLAKIPTLPSFGRYLFEKWKGSPLSEDYKYEITKEDYYDQDESYFGGFVANNKRLTKVLNVIDKNGKPNIISIDVNSMYPAIMANGLPVGLPRELIPSDNYATWYEGYFEKQVRPGVLYEFKPQYDQFNNKFFGDGFFRYSEEPGFSTRRVYLNKELFDVFNRVCNHHFKITAIRYQELDYSISKFIKTLYEIKRKPKNKQQGKAVKLIMNSLYGKMAERFHEDYWEWIHEKLEYKRLTREEENRNAILAGLYITSMARARLINDIADEIDNGNIFLGCDTDSIKLIENNPVKLPLHDDELGYWGLEGYYTDFVHNQKKKKYLLLNRTVARDHEDHLKYACSGIPSSIIKKLSDEDLILLFSEENDVKFQRVKNTSVRNELFQICITPVDVRFNYKRGRPVTHIYNKEENKIEKNEEKDVK